MKTTTRQHGMSLVELLVGLILSVATLGMVIQVFINSKQQYVTQDSIARIQENARQAMQYMAEDIRMAGFYGAVQEYWQIEETTQPARQLGTIMNECFNYSGSTPYRWAAPMIAINTTADPTASPPEVSNPPGIVGENNGASLFSGCILSSNHVTNTDVVSLHYADNQTVANGSVLGNRIYIRSNLQGGRIFQCGSNPSGCVGPSVFPTWLYGTGVNPTEPTPETANRPLVSHTYYVRPCLETDAYGMCPTNGSDNIPTLVRARLEYTNCGYGGSGGGGGSSSSGGGSMTGSACVVAEPIAEGVVDMQIRYGLDSDYDNYVDQYVDASDIDSGNINTVAAMRGWNNVLTVRIWLLIRSTAQEAGYADANTTYTIADGSKDTVAGYRYQLFTTTVALRNLAG
jgi:type IV pilus assembly protein PilW